MLCHSGPLHASFIIPNDSHCKVQEWGDVRSSNNHQDLHTGQDTDAYIEVVVGRGVSFVYMARPFSTIALLQGGLPGCFTHHIFKASVPQVSSNIVDAHLAANISDIALDQHLGWCLKNSDDRCHPGAGCSISSR